MCRIAPARLYDRYVRNSLGESLLKRVPVSDGDCAERGGVSQSVRGGYSWFGDVAVR
jgi:hypothetical protein